MEINLWDLPEDKIYVKFNETLTKELRLILKSQFKSLYKFKRSFETKTNKLMSKNAYYKWFSGKGFIPLWAINYFPVLFNFNKKILEKNVFSLKGSKRALELKNIKFPIYFSEEFARVISHLLADGCVTRGKVDYSNKNKDLITQFKKDCHKLFGNFDSRIYYRKGVYDIQLPSVIGYILSVFKISFFHNKIEVPRIIMSSNKNIKRQFLSAFYDDEGSVSRRTITLEITGKKAIRQITNLLKDFNIVINKISSRKRHRNHSRTYYFVISGKGDLITFYNEIGFSHKNKQKKLLNRINSYKRNQRKIGHANKEIVELLTSGEKTSTMLLNNMNIEMPCLSYHLKKLCEKGVVTKIKGKIDRDNKGRILRTYESKWKLM